MIYDKIEANEAIYTKALYLNSSGAKPVPVSMENIESALTESISLIEGCQQLLARLKEFGRCLEYDGPLLLLEIGLDRSKGILNGVIPDEFIIEGEQ